MSAHDERVQQLEAALRQVEDELAEREAELAQVRQELVQVNRELEERTEEFSEEISVLQSLALTDDLTGLRNIRAFREDMETEVMRVGRAIMQHDRVSGEYTVADDAAVQSLEIAGQLTRRDRELSLLYVDLIDFKTPNDKYGEEFGDEILKAVAKMILTCCRASDQAYRRGGDEFALILPKCGPEDAGLVIGRLRQAAEKFRFPTPDNQDLRIKLYFGLAYRNGCTTAEEIREAAAQALLKAKDQHKAGR